MRLLVLVLLVLGMAITASAQTFTPSVKSSTTETVVGEITIANKTFKGGTSKSGSIFIMRTSKKSGKDYKSYLGSPLEGKKYNGSQIYWANKKGEKIYYYFTINTSTGYPKKNYLDAN